MAPFLRIGIDVGGTNTDAVLLDTSPTKTAAESVLSWVKRTTTRHVTTGIQQATEELLQKSSVTYSDIGCVTVGTTHFINALVERDASKLSRVGVIRLASKDFTKRTPPFVDFPAELREWIYGYHGFVDGGLQIDGTEIGQIQDDQVVEQCKQLKMRNIQDIVVVGIYSPIDSVFKQENKCKKIIQRELGPVNVLCSSDVGQTGILERENAAVLNATIQRYATFIFSDIRRGLKKCGLNDCPLFVSCNDGSMISVAEAVLCPIRTFVSGPANSMLGASYLNPNSSLAGRLDDPSHLENGESVIVLDVGGTTIDAGVLMKNGYPREASAYSEIAKVQVNFPMPDVSSVGLGGGSIIRTTIEGSAISIGPESVGSELTTKALCFGGDVLTATDIAVAAGDAPGVGTVPVVLDLITISSSKDLIRQKFERIIDSVKTQASHLPVALVGGGAIISPGLLDGGTISSNSPLASVANAIGAATAKISASADVIYDTSGLSTGERNIIETTRDVAAEKCVACGAKRDTVRSVEETDMVMAYISNRTRVLVKVVGELDPGSKRIQQKAKDLSSDDTLKLSPNDKFHECHPPPQFNIQSVQAASLMLGQNLLNYHPRILEKQWYLSEIDVEFLSIGCYILGCAGGGSPRLEALEVRELLRQGETIRIVDARDLTPSGVLPPTGVLGSPMVSVERPGGNLCLDALKNMLQHLKLTDFEATLCVEIGGCNGISPLVLSSSAHYDRPMIDGDLMGRAYPTFEMITPYLYQESINDLLPVSLASGTGTDLVLHRAQSTSAVDSILRACCVDMGCAAGLVSRPLTVKEFLDYGLLHSHSLAWRIGRAVKKAQAKMSEDTIGDAIIKECGGLHAAKILFEGKITSVSNRLVKGHSIGELSIEGSTSGIMEAELRDSPGLIASTQMHIIFKNENLLAELVNEHQDRKILATVPDLIAVLDKRTGLAIGVPEYRYGLSVIVIATTASPKWTSERGLELGGPDHFGLGVQYRPVGVYSPPRSVIEEFGN